VVLRIVLLALIAELARTQDTDTAGFKSKQAYTILSSIEDLSERDAFLKIYSQIDPRKRQEAAEQFIAHYPGSWLLAQAYDLAAKSSIDQGELNQALTEGRFSLRLTPENPTLLVLLANVAAQKGLFEDVVTMAGDALEYLDEFALPASEAKPALKSSAYFALGRVYAARALRTSDPNLMNGAIGYLNNSIAWNSTDPEPFYLRGLLELKRGNSAAAKADLAFVVRTDNALKASSLARLRQLCRTGSFDQFLANIPAPTVGARPSSPDREAAPAIRAGYVGSAKCQSCHPHEYDAWHQTGMARMFREYKKENLIGDFAAPAPNDAIRPGFDTRPYFDVRDRTGEWRRYEVDYTIGSKWQQAYATRLDDGTFHVLPIQYNLLKKAWINYWEVIDPPGSERTSITDFPKLTVATNYQENCAVCHTSQLRAAGTLTETAQYREAGVNCEMCHGPSAQHVERMHSGQKATKDLLEPPLDFRAIDNRHGVQVCAQCHRQSAVRQLGPRGEMNYSASGSSFLSKVQMRPYDGFSRRAFYKDGRFRETTFIVEAFTRSACYRKGTAQCATCHAPHVSEFATNQASLKHKSNPNEMCLGCHQTYRAKVASHTHHPENTDASQCVSCHMPRIVSALLFKARSHQIEIPTADLTERFGQKESPNACLNCHGEKDASWARRSLELWRN
jgi:predicted CXXCH cytochrome family protein